MKLTYPSVWIEQLLVLEIEKDYKL
ncbi:hypothetical protein JL09_g5168 [Pichia kudriavzevii]|uniref:Uncharacterized protein n=1 Tax=Pichia kudriavzevii TaxID=4909 RepID=A0A099NUT5_PICKU|nr:hypothetical protein JL09_g5168 [Pichia kudriavzevii]